MVASLSLAALVLVAVPVNQADAAGSFQPGNIIADHNFYTSSPTMSVQQIQDFLNVQGKNCAPAKGLPCLKDYRQTTQSRPADKFCPKPYVGAANESAATIIWKTSQACNIAPQVLLVTLQKEQSLITSVANGQSGYRTAMGYGCPDGAPCAQKYYGFANQVYNAAHQFQRYRLQPHSFNFAAGRTSYVGFNPSRSCGGTKVKMENAATAALYNYTPYQPGGSGGCATYGNKNFNSFYRAWFGDPHAAAPSAPAPEPKQPAVNTTEKTGTETQTQEQVKENKGSAPAPKEAVKVVELKLNVTDNDGKAISSDTAVEPNSVMKLSVEGVEKDKGLVVSIDNAEQDVASTVKFDDKGIATAEVKVPNVGGKHKMVISEKGSEAGKEGAKKAVEFTFVALDPILSEPTIYSVALEDGKTVTSGGAIPASAKLSVRAGGFEEGEQPKGVLTFEGAHEKTSLVEVSVPKASERGWVDFTLKAPEYNGRYLLMLIPTMQTGIQKSGEVASNTNSAKTADGKANNSAQLKGDDKPSADTQTSKGASTHQAGQVSSDSEKTETSKASDKATGITQVALKDPAFYRFVVSNGKNTQVKAPEVAEEKAAKAKVAKEKSGKEAGDKAATEKVATEKDAGDKAATEEASKKAREAAEAALTTPSVDAIVDAAGKPIKNGAELAPGTQVSVELTGLVPNQIPVVELHSKPQTIAVPAATADGKTKAVFTVPSEPGSHNLMVGKKGGQGTLVSLFNFTVPNPKAAPTHQAQPQQTTGAKLAQTGQQTAPLLAAMIVLMGCGLAAMSYGRARQPISVN